MENTATLAKESTRDELIKRLQMGGNILYFRHATPANTTDPDAELGEEGKNNANKLKTFLANYNIKTHSLVSTSPLKRARQTAEIAFGSKNLIVDPSLAQMNVLLEDQSNADELFMKQHLTRILESKPEKDHSVVLVGHHFTFGGRISGIPYLGVVVIEPKGNGNSYEIITAGEPLIEN